MITIERFSEILDELSCELPQEFFDELNLGISIVDEAHLHPQAREDDLYILGEYERSQMGCGIAIFYGSFEKLHGDLDEEALKIELRSTLRHEFRHHMEYRAGERGLEVQDEEDLKKYLYDE
ncbi:MAG: metallopeptidase family protein [Oscillospiraceae bacterium]